MPAISTPKPDADAFLIMATEVHKLLTRPVGTEHARIRQLAKVLRDLANTNYDRGWDDALEADAGSSTGTLTPIPCKGSKVEIEGRLALIQEIDGDRVIVCMADNGQMRTVKRAEFNLVF